MEIKRLTGDSVLQTYLEGRCSLSGDHLNGPFLYLERAMGLGTKALFGKETPHYPATVESGWSSYRP